MGQTYQQPQRQVKNHSVRNSHRKPHQLFSRALRCQPWKFGSAATGRKYRIEQMRQAQLAYVLSRFDHTGDCKNIYAGAKAILRALVAYVANLPPDHQLSWSRATIFRTLKRLEAGGIMRRHAYSGYRTRVRSLVPEALLREPVRRESETSGRVESETSATANLRHKNSTPETSRGGSGCDGGGDDVREQTEAAAEVRRGYPAASAPVPGSLTEDQTQKQERIRTAFAAIGIEPPLDVPALQEAWLKQYEKFTGVTARSMELAIQEVGREHVPKVFYDAKRAVEKQDFTWTAYGD
jgi:hypothetical protein